MPRSESPTAHHKAAGLSLRSFPIKAYSCGLRNSTTDRATSPMIASTASGTQDTATIAGHRYRVHSFTTVGTSTFTVTAAVAPFDVLVIGGGGNGSGGGGGWHCSGGWGGDGGEVVEALGLTIASGANSVTIGAAEINSTAAGLTARGGTRSSGASAPNGGAKGGYAVQFGTVSASGAAGIVSTITGSSVTYAGGGGLGGVEPSCAPGAGGAGGGGAGGSGTGTQLGAAGTVYGAGGGGGSRNQYGGTSVGGAGYRGAVIIRYEVAP